MISTYQTHHYVVIPDRLTCYAPSPDDPERQYQSTGNIVTLINAVNTLWCSLIKMQWVTYAYKSLSGIKYSALSLVFHNSTPLNGGRLLRVNG